MIDLQRMQAQSVLPMNISTHFLSDLSHDFVVKPKMIDPVVRFCTESIRKQGIQSNKKLFKQDTSLISKL